MEPVQLGLSAAHDDGIRLRLGVERRQSERRALARRDPDRRRGERRRARLRSFALTALTILFPHQSNLWMIALPAPALIPATFISAPVATVTVTIDSYIAVPARRAYDGYIREAARRYRIDAALIRSVLQTESRFNALAVSPRGARGLMQLMPALVRQLKVQDPFDPRENIMAGARYLRQMLDLHDGDVRLALASYNAGPGNVMKYGDVPPFPETEDYVLKVTELIASAR